MSNPRTRSPFGQFQMSRSHLVTSVPDPEPPLPKAGEMAEMVRGGMSLEELGTKYDRSPRTLASRLNAAGFSANGKPRKTR